MKIERLREIAVNSIDGIDLIVPWSEVAQMARELLVLQWTRITPENLPKVGDEVGVRVDRVWVVQEVRGEGHDWFRIGYTHRRPLNAPDAEQG